MIHIFYEFEESDRQHCSPRVIPLFLSGRSSPTLQPLPGTSVLGKSPMQGRALDSTLGLISLAVNKMRLRRHVLFGFPAKQGPSKGSEFGFGGSGNGCKPLLQVRCFISRFVRGLPCPILLKHDHNDGVVAEFFLFFADWLLLMQGVVAQGP